MNPPFVPEGVKVLSIGELTREVKGLIDPSMMIEIEADALITG